MFNSTVLEVGIGLIFCFCAVSLIVSSINEGISSFLKLRGKYLLQGLQKLLNDPDVNGLVLDLYNHAQFNPSGSGTATSAKDLDNLPSYVAPRQFAVALSDILQAKSNTPGNLSAAIQSIPDTQLRQLLSSMYQRATGDINQFEAELAYWFDNAMQRLAGDYKRTIQWWTVLFGFLIAVVMNIDTLHLFKVLWVHPALVADISPDQATDAHTVLDQLSVTSLPVGWETPPFNYQNGVLSWNYSSNQLWLMAAGWLITALSTLFGAPFWFDLLQKATNLRGTGPKVS
jgi:hypothetical protein